MASSADLLAPPAPCADVYCDAYDEQYARFCAEVDGDVELVGSLAALPVGPLLVDLLSRLDPSGLNDVECLAYAGAVRRQQSWTDSLLTRAAARFVEHRPGPPREYESLVTGSEQRIHLGGELTPGVWVVRRRGVGSRDRHVDVGGDPAAGRLGGPRRPAGRDPGGGVGRELRPGHHPAGRFPHP